MANEKRLIDANAMKHRLEAHIATVIYKGINGIPTSYDSCNPTEYLKGYERGAIETANLALGQQIVDAVEVVRCKDCQMWKCHGMPFDITTGTCHNPIFHFHHGHVIDECFMPVTNETDFCSYGERREGE